MAFKILCSMTRVESPHNATRQNEIFLFSLGKFSFFACFSKYTNVGGRVVESGQGRKFR
jgi:hypothetical protein